MSDPAKKRINEDKDFDVEIRMNGRNGISRDQVYEQAKKTLAQTEHFMKKPNQSRVSSLNASTSSEDRTIDLNGYNFNPTEITGRSTACASNDESLSVEKILAQSQCSDIRALADELMQFKIRESCGGEQLANTADVSIASARGLPSTMLKPDDWDVNAQCGFDVGDVFMPSERVKEFLEREEQLFDDLPSTQSEQDLPMESSKRNTFELSDFSRFKFGNESATESNASVGQFFNKRSYDLREMLPNVSPTKQKIPVALMDSLDASKESNYKPNTSSQDQTFSKLSSKEEPYISLSTLDSYFMKCNNDSPQTIGNNLKKLKTAPFKHQAVHNFVKPIPEIVYISEEQLPLKPRNSNVNIVQVQKVYTDVEALLENSHISGQSTYRSTYLSPSGHIRKNHANKENTIDCSSNENVCQQSLSSDTLSMSQIEDDVLNSNIDDSALIDLQSPVGNLLEAKNCTQNSFEEKEVTPTNSPVRNRKRVRSRDRTNNHQSSINVSVSVRKNLDMIYNPKDRLNSPNLSNRNSYGASGISVLSGNVQGYLRSPNSPSQNSEDLQGTPTKSNLDVLYNPTHRLASPSLQSPKFKASQSTPPKSNLDVLYNPKHRLASPNVKSQAMKDVQSTPTKGNMDPFYKTQHRMGSANSSNTNFSKDGTLTPKSTPAANNSWHSSQTRAFENRSPKLLTQSNSQFSSISDLREFSIKSSHSVISWPSQKLRTPNMKQFTIKNIGGKKITLKIEVVGPGFQLSPSEPFQLIALQAQECRTISVTFCPTVLGAAIGKLNFCHAKDTAERNAGKIIPLFGYGGHTVLEVQSVSQGIVGNPFLQLGTVGDLLNMKLCATFSVYNKGPLKGVAIIRVKSDLKKPSSSSLYSALNITPSKCVIGPDSYASIEVVYRPRKNDVRKLLRQDGNVLGVATVEVFMADEPSRQRILGLINKFATNSSDIYLLDDLFRGINTDVVEDFRDFQETEDMIAELFNKMKSTEITLTVKRSTMDQTIESEHDFFLSDTNESMFFHTLVSDEMPVRPIPSTFTAMSSTITASQSAFTAAFNHPMRLQRVPLADDEKWFIEPTEITLNPSNNRATSEINIHSKAHCRQIFEVYSNFPNLFIFKPECGVINPDSVATVSITIKNCVLPNENIHIQIRVDKKQATFVPVIVDK